MKNPMYHYCEVLKRQDGRSLNVIGAMLYRYRDKDGKERPCGKPAFKKAYPHEIGEHDGFSIWICSECDKATK